MDPDKDVQRAEGVSEAPMAIIVAAVDTSPYASLVVEAAARLARRYWDRAELNIVHVFKTSALDRPPPGGGHASQMMDDARSYLDHHVRMAQRQTAAQVIGRFAVGDPTDEIVRVADSLSADMLVVSTLDSTGLERLLLGSVADDVVKRARCPVLVVRPKQRPPKRA